MTAIAVATAIILDLETCSTEDLRRAGTHRYAEHPDTRVICVCWQPENTVVSRCWQPGQPVPDLDLSCVVAHNFQFEKAIFEHILVPRYGWKMPKSWSCTMSRALYHGLPAGLELLGEAMPTWHRKSASGHGLMLRMCKPRSFDAAGKPVWWHETDPLKLAELIDYCRGDVRVEHELHLRLPELPPRELAVWRMDEAINARGMRLDASAISTLGEIAKEQGVLLDACLRIATNGAVAKTTHVSALSRWLEDRGYAVDSLDKPGVRRLLDAAVAAQDFEAFCVLTLRKDGALSSVAKLKAMRDSVSNDQRARGLFAYYGAGRTGRWAGRRIQPQNLVRGYKDTDTAIRIATLHGAAGLEVAYPGNAIDAIARMLRGVFVAAPGNQLVCVDLTQIEARVVAWLARQHDLLDVFRQGTEDVYLWAARQQGSENRQLGKILVLALGFGMGWEKLIATGVGYDVFLDEDTARTVVAGWRQQNRCIVALWRACDKAARQIIAGPDGTTASVGRLVFRRTRQAMRIRLPSERELIYQGIKLQPNALKPQFPDEITYLGVNGLTHRWERLRTYGGKLVENIVQAIARDVLADDMLVLHLHGHKIVGSVHDEIIIEAPEAKAQGVLKDVLAVMCRAPSWAPGLPCKAEGFVASRYRK